MKSQHVAMLGLCTTITLLASLGCATKRYGRLQPMSPLEVKQYDCDDLAIEASKVESFLKQVNEGSQVDGASVLGFLGDFGIGNSIEKNKAEESARERLEQIRERQAALGCL